MGKALIVFATRGGETEDIAKLIAEGIRFEGAEAELATLIVVDRFIYMLTIRRSCRDTLQASHSLRILRCQLDKGIHIERRK